MSQQSYEQSWNYQAELEAVNEILAAIGEAPVSTLTGSDNSDVISARRILNKHNRREQSLGWTFNTSEVSLYPDVYSSLIPWLPSYLRVLPAAGGSPYVNRGGYIYDKVAKTDMFTSPITVSLVELANFEEMPDVFRTYIVTKAAKEFNMNFFGSPDIDTVLANDLIEQKMAVMEYEIDYGSFNAFTSDPFIGQVIQR